MPPSLTPWWKIGTTGTRQWSWLLHGGSLGSPIWKDMEPHGSLGLSFQFCPSLTPFWHLAREPARLESTCPRPKCTDTWLSSLTDLNTISSLPERSKTSLQCAQLPWNSIHAKLWLFSFFLSFFRLLLKSILSLDFPGGTSGKELTCQCRRYKRCGFNSWVGKIPWRRS